MRSTSGIWNSVMTPESWEKGCISSVGRVAITEESRARFREGREEHSMDQCLSRLKLSENFERHWSILISGEIHMDQSLVHTFSWGNSYGPMVLKVLLKFSPTLVLVHGWLFPGGDWGPTSRNGISFLSGMSRLWAATRKADLEPRGSGWRSCNKSDLHGLYSAQAKALHKEVQKAKQNSDQIVAYTQANSYAFSNAKSDLNSTAGESTLLPTNITQLIRRIDCR